MLPEGDLAKREQRSLLDDHFQRGVDRTDPGVGSAWGSHHILIIRAEWICNSNPLTDYRGSGLVHSVCFSNPLRQRRGAMGFVSDAVDTRRIEGKSAIYAYRDFAVANSSPPLMLLTRFSG